MGPGVTYSPFRSPTVRQIAVPSTLNGGEYNAAALVTDERHSTYHSDIINISIIEKPSRIGRRLEFWPIGDILLANWRAIA
jgi:maleylacetate reductase